VSGDHGWPQREPRSYQPLVSRICSKYLDKDWRLERSVDVDLKREFWDAGIQIIIQVFSIDLTPEEPNYPGKEWHVQGQLVRMTAGETISSNQALC
jgi:cytochrome P450